MKYKLLFLTITTIFFGCYSSLFAAGVRFANRTPFHISVLLTGKKTKLLDMRDKTSAVVSYVADPNVTFTVLSGQTYFHDAGVGGFEGATITFATESLCTVIVQFSVDIPGITGIRDWILNGNSPENLSLYIGPTGLDREIGLVKGKVIKKIERPCPENKM
jgi:hypothetical protein